jgi:hypothetical protein
VANFERLEDIHISSIALPEPSGFIEKPDELLAWPNMRWGEAAVSGLQDSGGSVVLARAGDQEEGRMRPIDGRQRQG